MLNSKSERELAYLVKIDDIQPITGSDNCESAVVGAWHIMTRKGTFNVGDPAIYFEIDSLVDTSKPEFAFMEKYHGKIKTQKYTFGGKGNFISQGLLMHPSDFGWTIGAAGTVVNGEDIYNVEDESRFLTKVLGVKYYDPEDEKRKKNPKAGVPQMPKFFRAGVGRAMMRVKWLRPILYRIFGKKKKVTKWPHWVVKTDEERVQNIPWIISEEDSWIATEKIDGTSTTFTMIRHGLGFKFYVCSRNVVFDSKNKDKCYYDTNVYLEMAQKYNVEELLKQFLKIHDGGFGTKKIDWITIQCETYGAGIQKRDYSLNDHRIAVFNVIDSVSGRWNSVFARSYWEYRGLPFVPILDESFKMPATVDELLQMVEGNSVIDGKPREGMVFRSHDGKKSFKAVSNSYLLKYHG